MKHKKKLIEKKRFFVSSAKKFIVFSLLVGFFFTIFTYTEFLKSSFLFLPSILLNRTLVFIYGNIIIILCSYIFIKSIVHIIQAKRYEQILKNENKMSKSKKIKKKEDSNHSNDKNQGKEFYNNLQNSSAGMISSRLRTSPFNTNQSPLYGKQAYELYKREKKTTLSPLSPLDKTTQDYFSPQRTALYSSNTLFSPQSPGTPNAGFNNYRNSPIPDKYEIAPPTRAKLNHQQTNHEVYFDSVDKGLKELNITTDQLDDWRENMRKWLSKYVLADVLNTFKQYNNLRNTPLNNNNNGSQENNKPSGGFGSKSGGFGSSGFGNKSGGFGSKSGGFGSKSGGFGSKSGGFGSSGFGNKSGGFFGNNNNNSNNNNNEQQEYYQRVITDYQNYLNLNGYPNKKYIENRIQELAYGNYLETYKWNGGGYWKNEKWSAKKELPTDTQILIHLFCTFMDKHLIPIRQNETKPFTNNYFLSPTESPNYRQNIDVFIHQTQSGSNGDPPHFEIITWNKNNYSLTKPKTYKLYKGKHNMLDALILFVYFVKTEYYGYLGRVTIESKQINLISVVD